MKRLISLTAAIAMLAAPAFAGGYAAGIGGIVSVNGTAGSGSYGSIDGGGAVTGKGTVYATSQSSNNEGSQQSYNLSGGEASSYSTQQGSGYVTANNADGKGGVDYAAGGSSDAEGNYALTVAGFAAEYGGSNW